MKKLKEFMLKIRFSWYLIKLVFTRKEDSLMDSMVVIYVTLIIKGKKTIDQVPMILREKAKKMLIDLDLPELAVEESEKA